MIPSDSTDANEQRNRDQLDNHAHRVCVDGWLGTDTHTRPIPCPRCRPHLFARRCNHCLAPHHLCSRRLDKAQRRCCGSCHHPNLPAISTLIALRKTP